MFSSVGRELADLYQSLTNARSEITERVAYLRGHWHRTAAQLDIIERTWPSLSEEHRAVQTDVLGILVVKLTSARHKLDRLLKPRTNSEQPDVKRWKYVFLKPQLDETIQSLDTWQRMYDPSWYLIIRIANSVIDAELRRKNNAQPAEGLAVRRSAAKIRSAVRGDAVSEAHVSLPSDGLLGAQTSTILYSTARHLRRTSGKESYIVDSVPSPPGSSVGHVDKDVRTLATKLRCADPATFSVLRCKGILKVKNETGTRVTSFDIVFEVPSPETPRTLRSCLTSQVPHSLTERMELAKQLARSVNYVHTLDFVHKNIRPENFLGFGEAQLGAFYLIGFEQVRTADGMTYFRGDGDWHKNLYRHPERQGLQPEEKYCMQHDIYSLGVCLLEIGLWDSFVRYRQDGKVEGPNTDLFRCSVEGLRRKKPDEIKNLLVTLARDRLPAVVGELYKQVVLNCLTCLDEDNADFGDRSEFEDADGVKVGVRFIERVCLTFRRFP